MVNMHGTVLVDKALSKNEAFHLSNFFSKAEAYSFSENTLSSPFNNFVEIIPNRRLQTF